jgi:hypothetical protein
LVSDPKSIDRSPFELQGMGWGSQNVEAPNPHYRMVGNSLQNGFEMCFEEKQLKTIL